VVRRQRLQAHAVEFQRDGIDLDHQRLVLDM
jgi:hypothetical protein